MYNYQTWRTKKTNPLVLMGYETDNKLRSEMRTIQL